jgi:hypothetical protein
VDHDASNTKASRKGGLLLWEDRLDWNFDLNS